MNNYSTYGEIYCIENKNNHKKYVGLTTRGVMKRFKEHCEAESYIGRAIRKNGIRDFYITVIDSAENENELKAKEIHWIEELKTFENGYNLTRGGDGVNQVKRVDFKLNERQSNFCSWVRKENQLEINVNNASEMIEALLINVSYLYLTARLERDKIDSAKTICKLKPIYLNKILKLNLINVKELKRYSNQK